MRITVENLLKFTQDFVKQRVKSDHTILAVYLTGGMNAAEPLWCSAVDIDLVFIHHAPPKEAHEVAALLPDVHFDIEHHNQQRYESTRNLRGDAILAPALYAAQGMYDGGHFFDFVQAGVRSQYARPEYVYQRAAPLLEQARRNWLGLNGKSFSVGFVQDYLHVIMQAAQALACLADVLLTPRRFILQYGRALSALKQDGIFQGFLGLLGMRQGTDLQDYLPAWEAAWQVNETQALPKWSALRRAYFRGGIETLLAGEMPGAALWPLLTTWTEALENESVPRDSWERLLTELGLCNPEERVQALDAALDVAEQTLEAWGQANGVL